MGDYTNQDTHLRLQSRSFFLFDGKNMLHQPDGQRQVKLCVHLVCLPVKVWGGVCALGGFYKGTEMCSVFAIEMHSVNQRQKGLTAPHLAA